MEAEKFQCVDFSVMSTELRQMELGVDEDSLFDVQELDPEEEKEARIEVVQFMHRDCERGGRCERRRIDDE